MQHGIVFCKNPMSVNNPYVEFNVSLNIKLDHHEYPF